MNVYDFDGTIYEGDSSVDFFLYELKRHFSMVLMIPRICFYLVLGKLHIMQKEKIKSYFFSFFKMVDNIESDMKHFAEKNQKKIAVWYLQIMKRDDVIITASPQPLVRAFLDNLLGQECIGTQIELDSGAIIGKNCYGEEKVIRFQECHKLDQIDMFYTDSLSDLWIANYAKLYYIIGKK